MEISFPRFLILWFAKPSKYQQLWHSQPERASAFQASKRIMVLNRVSSILGQEYHIFGNETQRFCALYVNDRRYVAKSINLDINQLYVSERFDNSRFEMLVIIFIYICEKIPLYNYSSRKKNFYRFSALEMPLQFIVIEYLQSVIN